MFGHNKDTNPDTAPPAPPTHPPITTCPVCGGTSLSESKVVATKIAQTANNPWQGERWLQVSMVICDQCGRMEWFAVGAAAQGRASTVEVVLGTGPQGAT
jgi:predicted nucleic-acid-binding Zn-ribbon protein